MNIHENVTIPGTLQTLQNLLHSRDEEEANALITELDISWASKAEQVDLVSLVKDDLSTSLVPDNICGKVAAGRSVALKVKGDGNCLYNSASLVLYGDEWRSHHMHFLVAEELYCNTQFYASHEIFKIVEKNSGIPESVLFPAALSRDGDGIFTSGGSRPDAVKAEAIAGCQRKKWSCLFHFMPLATVLRWPIVSLYLNIQFKHHTLLHNTVLKPHLPPLDNDDNDPVYLLWSRDGNLDSRPTTWYIADHFVPIVWL